MSTIVTRAGKGSPLTHTEVDTNFTNLNTDKLQSGNTAASLAITSADINGGTIDGTAIGSSSASTGAFTTLSASGVTTVSAGTVSAPAITTTGDTNTGIFFPAADTIAFSEGGTEAMRIDSSGNVGIGTSSPNNSYRLDIQSTQSATRIQSTTGTNIAFLTLANTGTDMYVGREGSAGGVLATGTSAYSGVVTVNGTYPLAFGTNGAERMRLDSSGNLGLGVTPSAWGGGRKILQMSNGAAFGDYSGFTGLSQNYYNNGTSDLYIANGTATRYLQGTGQHLWYTAPSGTAGNAITFTQAMTLDASGRLGIGVTSPLRPIDVLQKGSDAEPAILLRGYTTGSDGSRTVAISCVSSDANNWANIQTNAHQFIWSYQGGTERMRINSSGNLGIGTSSPALKLHVAQSSDGDGIRLSHNSRATTTYWDTSLSGVSNSNLAFKQYDGTSLVTSYSAGRDDHYWYTGGTERMVIDSSGNLKFNSGYGSAATAYGCRAWVNFNGTGTVAIRASGNVSSITDNGTGDYTVNFTNAMPNVNYCAVGTVGDDSTAVTSVRVTSFNTYATGSVRMRTLNNNTDDAQDVALANVSVFR